MNYQKNQSSPALLLKDKEGVFHFDDLPEFIEENEESIIRYIVAAGLRDRDVSQIRNSDPVLLAEDTNALVS